MLLLLSSISNLYCFLVPMNQQLWECSHGYHFLTLMFPRGPLPMINHGHAFKCCLALNFFWKFNDESIVISFKGPQCPLKFSEVGKFEYRFWAPHWSLIYGNLWLLMWHSIYLYERHLAVLIPLTLIKENCIALSRIEEQVGAIILSIANSFALCAALDAKQNGLFHLRRQLMLWRLESGMKGASRALKWSQLLLPPWLCY